MKERWISVTILLVSLLQGCGNKYENEIQVAHCRDVELYVNEMVDTATGARGGEFVRYSLYFTDKNKRKSEEIGTSINGSYKLPTSVVQLKMYRLPQHGDWQLFISPKSVNEDGYEALASCIMTNMEDIYEKMMVSRPPHDRFPSHDRVLPKIATIRYMDLNDLKKEYQCDAQGDIHILEDGLIYIRLRNSRSLIGVVIEDGEKIVLDEKAMRYFEKELSEIKIAEPNTYTRQCKNAGGRSMYDEFKVSSMPSDAIRAELTLAKKRATFADSYPNSAVEASKPKTKNPLP